ncbi:MAG: FeoC-like transcriptional regulator [Anaerolineaceae bacterium]
MLQQLLEEIKHEDSLDIKRLADHLNTSPEMIMAMLEHLVRMGVIEKVECCAQACEGCSLIDQCASTNKGSALWEYKSKE